MADPAYTNALARRDAVSGEIDKLKLELESLQKEVVRIEDWLAVYHEFALQSEAHSHVTATSQPPTATANDGKPQSTSVTRKNPSKEVVARFTYNLAKDRGRPVPRESIMAALQNDGVEIEGKDPEMVVSTMLWRQKDVVVRLKPYGYWMADQPFPEAGYYPESLISSAVSANGSNEATGDDGIIPAGEIY